MHISIVCSALSSPFPSGGDTCRCGQPPARCRAPEYSPAHSPPYLAQNYSAWITRLGCIPPPSSEDSRTRQIYVRLNISTKLKIVNYCLYWPKHKKQNLYLNNKKIISQRSFYLPSYTDILKIFLRAVDLSSKPPPSTRMKLSSFTMRMRYSFSGPFFYFPWIYALLSIPALAFLSPSFTQCPLLSLYFLAPVYIPRGGGCIFQKEHSCEDKQWKAVFQWNDVGNQTNQRCCGPAKWTLNGLFVEWQDVR